MPELDLSSHMHLAAHVKLKIPSFLLPLLGEEVKQTGSTLLASLINLLSSVELLGTLAVSTERTTDKENSVNPTSPDMPTLSLNPLASSFQPTLQDATFSSIDLSPLLLNQT